MLRRKSQHTHTLSLSHSHSLTPDQNQMPPDARFFLLSTRKLTTNGGMGNTNGGNLLHLSQYSLGIGVLPHGLVRGGAVPLEDHDVFAGGVENGAGDVLLVAIELGEERAEVAPGLAGESARIAALVECGRQHLNGVALRQRQGLVGLDHGDVRLGKGKSECLLLERPKGRATDEVLEILVCSPLCKNTISSPLAF